MQQDGVPQHIAIIMDGNGRWAQKRGLNRAAGHQEGARRVTEIVEHCQERGVRHLTLYAFSSENWHRPEAEVSMLMTLLGDYLMQEGPKLIENKISFRTIGRIEKLPKPVIGLIESLKNETKKYTDRSLTLALSYGGRDELVRAFQRGYEAIFEGRLDAAGLDEEKLSQFLDTEGLPDPDLFIRTSGELRLSNFLLYQLSYAELYFTDCLWPDFGTKQLDSAIKEYQGRRRRFGLTSEQIEAN